MINSGQPDPSLDATTTAEKTTLESTTNVMTTNPETTSVKSISHKTATTDAQTAAIRTTNLPPHSTAISWQSSTQLMTSKEIQLAYNCDKMPFDAFTEVGDGSTYAFKGMYIAILTGYF